MIVQLNYSEPAGAPTTVAAPGIGTTFAIMLSAAITVILGVAPSLLLNPAGAASVFLP